METDSGVEATPRKSTKRTSSAAGLSDDGIHNSGQNVGGNERTDKGGAGSKGSGGPNHPIELSKPQGTRASDSFTVCSAGTTFIGAGTDGTADNIWYNFPWEFYPMFIDSDTGSDLLSSHQWWKFESIEITFKNPLCIQDIGTGASGLVAAGQNFQADLYGYCDDMYNHQLDHSAYPKGYSSQDHTMMNEIIESWNFNGYKGGAPKVLMDDPTIDPRYWTVSHPDTQQCGMGNGEHMVFNWRCPDEHWRHVSLLAAAGNTGDVPQYEHMFRWDQLLGTVGYAYDAAYGLAPEHVHYTQPIPGNLYNRDEYTFCEDHTAAVIFEVPDTDKEHYVQKMMPNIMHKCKNPIPRIYLALQPQLGSISAGVSNSVCQVQFEMKVHLKLTGRIARSGVLNSNQVYTKPSRAHGKAHTEYNQIPLFQPIMLRPLVRPDPP